MLSIKNIKNVASNTNLNEITALRRSFLIYELVPKINKLIKQKIKITYFAKIGAKFIIIEIIVAKITIENNEHFIKLFSQ